MNGSAEFGGGDVGVGAGVGGADDAELNRRSYRRGNAYLVSTATKDAYK